MGAKFVREIENGEIVVIENQKVSSIKPFPKQKPGHVYLNIYTLRVQIVLSTVNVHMNIEKNFGKQLAKESDINADIVIPVPDSGVPAALGFAEESKKKFELGLIRNHYVGRTFIEPSQNIRSLGVKLKLSSTKVLLKTSQLFLLMTLW